MTLTSLPMAFEENRGQHGDRRVVAVARGEGYDVAVERNGSVVFGLRQGARQATAGAHATDFVGIVRLDLVGARPDARVALGQALPGRANYLVGSDPAKWRRGIPRYAQVRFEHLLHGVDLLYYGRGRRLEYDFVVQPGADPSRIAVRASGAEKLKLSASGDLLVAAHGTDVQLSRPVAYQTIAGRRRDVPARFTLRGPREIGFDVEAYDRSQPLVIDPVLSYATYLGGSGDDAAKAVAVGPDGSTYVTGYTTSTDFPQAATRLGASTDRYAFIAKFAPDGRTLEYATYVGGGYGAKQGGMSIAVDAAGEAHVAGHTYASDFPTVNAISNQSSGTAFVLKLSADGSSLRYSTKIDLSGETTRVAVASDGGAFVAGSLYPGLRPPVVTALQAASKGGYEAWVGKFDGVGNLAWATFLGGASDERVGGLATDAVGNVYVGGATASRDFPTTAGAVQRTMSGDVGYTTPADDLSWTALSLEPNINALATTPDGATVYAATRRGLFSSADGGGTWTPVGTDLAGMNLLSIAISRSNPAVLYAGTDRSTVYKTSDGGANWSLLSDTRLGGQVAALAVHPADPAIAFVAVSYSGVSKTTDGGLSWTKLQGGWTASDIMFSLAFDAGSAAAPAPSTVYVGSSSGVYKSADGGGAWTRTDAGMGSPWSRRIVVADPETPGRVFLIGMDNGYASADAGTTWAPFAGPFQQYETPSVLAVVPGTGRLYAVFNADYYTSADAGQTWTKAGMFLNNNPTAAAYSSAGGGRVLIAAPLPTDIFVTKISPNGQSLQYSTLLGGPGGAGDQLYDLKVDASGAAVLGGRASAGFPVTRDTGADWSGPWSYPLLAKLDASGSALSFAQILQSQPGYWMFITRLALGPHGEIFTFGDAPSSPVFPLPDVSGSRGAGKMSADGTAFRYLTPLPLGWGEDAAGVGDIAVDPAGRAVVVGTATPGASTVNGYQSQAAGGPDAFVLRLDTTPTVNGVAPSTLPTTGGTIVTISGWGFTAGMSVRIGATDATGVEVTSGTTITAVAPPHDAGTVDVVVTSADGETAVATGGLTYVAPAPPVITGINPSSGQVHANTLVELTGTGFAPGAWVTFGGVAAGVIGVEPTRISAYAPPGEVGTVDVRVANRDGQSFTLANAYTYLGPAPFISWLSASSGSDQGGDLVTINGFGFQPGASVKIGGIDVVPQTVLPSSITFVTPAHTAGMVDVTVVNPDGQIATLFNAFRFAGLSLSGTVRSGDKVLAGVWVNAYRASVPYAAFAGSVQTDANGVYRFTGFTDGTYFLRTSNSLGYVDEQYKDVPCPLMSCSVPGNGIGVSVAASQPPPVVDFDLALGGTISGVVKDAEGLTISGISITLYSQTGARAVSTSTNAAGVFTLPGIVPGAYYVQAGSPWLNYRDQLYPGVSCPAAGCVFGDATPIQVVAGQVTDTVNFVLAKGATISGAVREAGTGTLLSSARVDLYTESGVMARSAYFSSYMGSYQLGGLSEGTYYLRTTNTPGYVDQLYRQLPCTTGCAVTSGTPVQVGATSAVTGIDFELFKSATVTLGSLEQPYDGTAHPVTVTTTPANLKVVFTYIGTGNTSYPGSTMPPTEPGTYAVTATVDDLSYWGTARGTLTITNTAPGTNVQVKPVDPVSNDTPVSLTFGEVTVPGATEVATSTSGPEPPANFSVVGTYYDISTTAQFSGPATVCIVYSWPAEGYSGAEENLQLWHYENGQWVALPISSHDLEKHEICGSTSSFSPFAIFASALTPPVITVTTPAEGAAFTVGETVIADYACVRGDAAASCSATDDAGRIVAAGGVIDTTVVGRHWLQVTAPDGSRDPVTKTVNYSVGYRVAPLYDPAKAKPAGSTFPVKIRLEDAVGHDLSSPAIVVSAVGLKQLSTAADGVVEDAGQSNPDANFRYTDEGYVFNLQTKGLTTGTYELRLRCGADPTVQTVQFQLR